MAILMRHIFMYTCSKYNVIARLPKTFHTIWRVRYISCFTHTILLVVLTYGLGVIKQKPIDVYVK